MGENGYTRITHEVSPVFNSKSEILILGTLPSVKSREGRFFYHHPQNRFWRVIAAVTGRDAPIAIEEKKRLLLENKIALWDVIAQCDIRGSSDSSIKNVIPNDLSLIFEEACIKQVYTNGGTAFKLYEKYCKDFSAAGHGAIKLPSTSPANAAYSLEKLIKEWSVILE